MQHFRADAVHHGKRDAGAVLHRIDMRSEETLSKRHVDDSDNRIRDRGCIGLWRSDRGKCLEHVLAEDGVRASFVLGNARRVGRRAGVRKMIAEETVKCTSGTSSRSSTRAISLMPSCRAGTRDRRDRSRRRIC
jgi:hypothetical protein